MRGVLVALLGAMVLAAPLAFGGAIRQAEVWLETGAALALLVAVFLPRQANHERSSPVRRAAAVLGWSLAGLVGLGLLQSLPLPAGLVSSLSAEHAARWSAASRLVDRRLPFHLSLDPEASHATALLVATALATGLAAAAVADRRWARRVLAAAVLAAALFQGVFGAWRWGPRTPAIWGVETPDGSPRMRGTFVNPDHLADLLAMALAVAFAAAWLAQRRTRGSPSVERRVLLVAPPVLAWLTLFVTLAFTGSRGGLMAAVAGAGLQAVLAGARRFGRRRALLLAGLVVAAGLGAVAFVGWRQGLGRFLDEPVTGGLGSRGQAYVATLALWQRFPLLGSGLGSFRAAFPLVQPPDLSGSWWHAHSDLLELLATGGILGAALGVVAVLALGRGLVTLWLEAERSEERAMALAAIGAAVAILAHELVDFGLTMPANALVLAVLCGLGLGTPREVRRRASHAPE